MTQQSAEFNTGDILMCKSGKYVGMKVEVIFRHNVHKPMLYSCKVMANGKEVALYDHEIETLFEHDMRMIAKR